MRTLRTLFAMHALGLLVVLLGTAQPPPIDDPHPVTAIDIALEPDKAMMQHAKAANARLRKKFNPHVTIGLAKEDFLKKMREEKFVDFNFSPIGVSVYHFGNYGTARAKLKGWELKP